MRSHRKCVGIEIKTQSNKKNGDAKGFFQIFFKEKTESNFKMKLGVIGGSGFYALVKKIHFLLCVFDLF